MPRLLIVVEGYGEVDAAPLLVRRVLTERGHHHWQVDGPGRRLDSLPAFQSRPARIVEFLRLSRPDAALLLFDLDDAERLPCEEGPRAASLLRGAGLPFPVAIVLARREYEAWILASIETVASSERMLSDELTCPEDPESIRDAKGWLTSRMPSGQSYKPRLDQARLTQIDFVLARQRSRSFRRLCHAIDQLVAGAPGEVTP